MPTLLHLDASPLETSVSQELTWEFGSWTTAAGRVAADTRNRRLTSSEETL